MRKKKRYVLFKTLPRDLPQDSTFLFQTEEGYVVRVSPKDAEALRCRSVRISGSIRKLKFSKIPK
ncbi:MAG: hypothetical protein ACRECH_11235 [Nitrososphaerales archaeon]